MSQQQKQVPERFQKCQFSLFNNNNGQFYSIIDSSFSQLVQQNMANKNQATQKVLKKVSQIIIDVHSTLIPKTQKLQIYRNLSRQQHQLLQKIKNDPLSHTILAGVLAVESCLKQIAREENTVIGRLMKGVTVMLGNFNKLQAEFSQRHFTKINSQDDNQDQLMLKLWDSMKLVVNDLHKLPCGRIKMNEIERHNELINHKSGMNNDLVNLVSRQQNLVFSLLVQQNNHQRSKISELEKKLTQKQQEKQALIKKEQQLLQKNNKNNSNVDDESKKDKLFQSPITSAADEPNFNNDTASESRNTQDSLLIIKQLNQQILQKEETIKRMNHEFTIEIQKYDKIFQKLQEDNRILKNIVDIQMPNIIESLQYQIGVLKEEKRQYQTKFSQLVNQVNRMACINIQPLSSYQENSSKNQYFSTRPRTNTRFNPSIHPQKFYQNLTKRSQCPSASPSNKKQQQIGRYFSPTLQPSILKSHNYTLHRQYGYQAKNIERKFYNKVNFIEKPRSKYKREKSPTFGNSVIQDEPYANRNQRVEENNNYRKRQAQLRRENSKPYVLGQVRRSHSRENPIKISQISQDEYKNEGKNQYELLRVKRQMKRSKFINQDVVYL